MEEPKRKKEQHEDDDVYSNEEVEEQLEEDELKPGEAGFMEGYNERQRREPKKFKDIVQDEK